MALNSYTPNPADSTPQGAADGIVSPRDIQARRPGLLGILIGLLLFSLVGILIGLLLFTLAPLSIAGGAVNALSGGHMCDVNGDAPYAPLGSLAGFANGIDALRATGGGAPLIDFCKLPAVQAEPDCPPGYVNPDDPNCTAPSDSTCIDNGVCDPGENSSLCPNDCPPPVGDCPPGYVDPNNPNCTVTSEPACIYNGVCDPGETTEMCPNDCPPPVGDCPPGYVDPNNPNCTVTSEPACIYNGVCDPGENSSLCPNDCPPPGGPICGAVCYSDGDCAGLGPNPKCIPTDGGYGTCYDDLKCGQGDGSSTNDGGDQGGNDQGGGDQCTETKCGDQKCDAACGENPNSCSLDCK